MIIKAPVYNIKAEKVGDLTLPNSYFAIQPNQTLVATAIRVYLSNQRRSHAKTKNRAEVKGSTRKIWAQKGTGRARHGSRKAPIFVGGGVAHGPRGDRNYKLKLNKKSKKLALKSVFSQFTKDNKLIIIDKISPISPKTKVAAQFLQKLKKANKILAKSKKIGLITTKTLDKPQRAFNNIPGLNLLSLKSLNTYQLAQQHFLLISKAALSHLK